MGKLTFVFVEAPPIEHVVFAELGFVLGSFSVLGDRRIVEREIRRTNRRLMVLLLVDGDLGV